MTQNIHLKAQINRTSKIPRHIKVQKRKRKQRLTSISIGILIIGSFILTKNLYVFTNSKDLGFAVEYNFTNGYPKEDKLLRVQYMTLVSREDDTAVVEVSGLSKSSPHKSTKLQGVFKKNFLNSWYLDSIDNNI